METSLMSNLKRLSNIVSITCKSMQQIQDTCSKNFIGINDNQSNISKTVKALKILDQDLNRTKARSTKLFDKVQEEKQNQITKPCKVAEEVALFLNIRDQLSIQSTDSTKSASRNFNKFMDNFSIIKRLYEEENQSLSYIARWMRMSELNLEHWIHRYYKQLARQSEDSKKKEQRKQRLDLIGKNANLLKTSWIAIKAKMSSHSNKW